jgi:hypothetical protein
VGQGGDPLEPPALGSAPVASQPQRADVFYTGRVETLAAIRAWGVRRRLVAFAAGASWLVLSGVPTDLIDTPLFVRMTPPEWWNYPSWVAGAVLLGLLAATYVAGPARNRADASHGGKVFGGGLLSVFAVGCPVCNKLVVLALGAGGALTYFAPVQPVLALLTLGLLLYALGARLAGEKSCSVAVPEG